MIYPGLKCHLPDYIHHLEELVQGIIQLVDIISCIGQNKNTLPFSQCLLTASGPYGAYAPEGSLNGRRISLGDGSFSDGQGQHFNCIAERMRGRRQKMKGNEKILEGRRMALH